MSTFPGSFAAGADGIVSIRNEPRKVLIVRPLCQPSRGPDARFAVVVRTLLCSCGAGIPAWQVARAAKGSGL